MKRSTKAALIIICVCLAFSSTALSATEESGAGKKYLTKAEAAKLLSATDFLKQKIGELLSWSVGYDISAVSRARLVPSIKYIRVAPIKVPPDGRTVISILVAVEDPSGPGNISGVRADLSSIGHLPNMALVDTGLWGDTKSGDGVYTIQTNVKAEIMRGEKEIPVAVANKKGWLALSRASLAVEKDPTVLWAKASPSSVKAGDKFLLEVAVENPGRIEDVTSVIVDLRPIGGQAEIRLQNNGTAGDKKAADNIFSLEMRVPDGAVPGEKKLPVSVKNVIDGAAFGEISVTVSGR